MLALTRAPGLAWVLARLAAKMATAGWHIGLATHRHDGCRRMAYSPGCQGMPLTAPGHVLDQLTTGPQPTPSPPAASLSCVYGPFDCFSSGWFSVRSPRSRRQGFAYSAGGRGSSSRYQNRRLPAQPQRADFTPGHRCCTPRADDAAVGNGPQPPHKPPPLRLTRPPEGTALVSLRLSRPAGGPALHHSS